MKLERIEIPFGDRTILIETGKLAKQANGAVIVSSGGTTVLVAACMAKEVRADIDFFPLMVEYQEKTYAAGRIPGGFFKREGRPTQKEVLTARIIDRPIRPLFPEGFYNEVVVTATVFSSDGEIDPDVLAILGASAALQISDIPFDGPIGAVRVGMIDDKFVLNPTYAQREQSPFELVVAGFENGVIMIEGEAKEAPEAKIVEAIDFAHKSLKPLIDAQKEFCKRVGKPKAQVALFKIDPALKKKVSALIHDELAKVYQIGNKQERENALYVLKERILSDLTVFADVAQEDQEISKRHITSLFDQIEYDVVRDLIFNHNKRADGRGPKDIREVTCEIDFLPRTHGSSLFTRGQTQCLAVVTLGTRRDEQMVESLEGTTYSNFMLHYNFPAFSVGEAKGSRGPGRREIGHGALASKALSGVLPSKDEFPYTIRVVSEILESNGSSSMATVCAGCLSLMTAGVPIKNPVAGISIGLVTADKGKHCLLTDIMGLEDHFGDMDFKVAGSRNGVTAIQLDLKIQGVSTKILADAVNQARDARLKILDIMTSVIAKPNPEISMYAPRIITIEIPQDKIGELIGPGGKMIKKIIELTGVETIDIDDDGKVLIASTDKDSAQKALDYVKGMMQAPEIGKIYEGVVMKVANFGAFVEFLPGKQGLVHVSELSDKYVKDVASVVKVGDKFKVKLVEIDQMKRMNLSKKQAETADIK